VFVPSAETAWLEALRRCGEALDSIGVPYSLDGGTILGLARDGTFIQHDKDLDLTLFEQQARFRDIEAALKSAGFKSTTVRNLAGPVGTHKIVPSLRSVRIDIVNKRDRDGMAAWVIYGSRVRLKTVPASFYEDLGTLKVGEYAFSVPRELEAYLVCRWGRTWRTPILGPNYKRYSMDLAYPSARNERRPA
jgi:lipopolysaccharide cholinephosphotransferase